MNITRWVSVDYISRCQKKQDIVCHLVCFSGHNHEILVCVIEEVSGKAGNAMNLIRKYAIIAIVSVGTECRQIIAFSVAYEIESYHSF